MTAKTMTFDVLHPGEPAAGILGYSDQVTVIVESGDPGGDPLEFEEFIRSSLAEWFDGARVTGPGGSS